MSWVIWAVDIWAMAVLLIVSIAMLLVALTFWRELRPPSQKVADQAEAAALVRLKEPKPPTTGMSRNCPVCGEAHTLTGF